MPEPQAPLEADPRFPSGPWVGFFMHSGRPTKYAMDLRLRFSQGVMAGDGRDLIGLFTIQGKYSVSDGQCYWKKNYIGKHEVDYRGFNEGKGIWGTWMIDSPAGSAKGGFHIWPEGMADPTLGVLKEEVDVPKEIEQPAAEPVLV